jgi:hypothetical protein
MHMANGKLVQHSVADDRSIAIAVNEAPHPMRGISAVKRPGVPRL